MANKTNCVINGVPYYRIRKKIGMKMNSKGEWVTDIKPFYGKNKSDAENQIREWEENHRSGINKDEYVAKLLHYYVNEVFMNGSHAAGSKIRYKGVYDKYIKNSNVLKEYRMNEINGQIIQSFFNDLKGKTTNSTMIAARNVLTLFFQYAELQGYCRNPMGVIKISKPNVKSNSNDIIIFTNDEIKKIVESKADGQHSYNRFLFCFALGTGLRQGELLALKYSDIINGQVKVVRQAITDTDKKRRIADTKTKNSIRYVPIPKPLLSELAEMKKCHKDEDHIFLSRKGNLMDVNNLIRSYKRFLKSIGVPYKDFHTLRRTYATTLCENGVDINTVAKLLGNTVAVAAQYYTFVSDQLKIAAVDKIETLFSGNHSHG